MSSIYCQRGWLFTTYDLLREPEKSIDIYGSHHAKSIFSVNLDSFHQLSCVVFVCFDVLCSGCFFRFSKMSYNKLRDLKTTGGLFFVHDFQHENSMHLNFEERWKEVNWVPKKSNGRWWKNKPSELGERSSSIIYTTKLTKNTWEILGFHPNIQTTKKSLSLSKKWCLCWEKNRTSLFLLLIRMFLSTTKKTFPKTCPSCDSQLQIQQWELPMTYSLQTGQIRAEIWRRDFWWRMFAFVTVEGISLGEFGCTITNDHL